MKIVGSSLRVGDVVEGRLTLTAQASIEYTARVVDWSLTAEGHVVVELELLENDYSRKETSLLRRASRPRS